MTHFQPRPIGEDNSGLSGVTSFSNLLLRPSENLLGTIISTLERIPLAIVDGAIYTQITTNDIVFA